MSFSIGFVPSTKWLKRTASAFCIGGSLVLSQVASATTVQFQTVLGNFEVNLFDKTTPITVANFLAYVNNGSYVNSIVHRSVNGFVIQGGGYQYNNKMPLDSITQKPKITNEPVYSNLRGTIAMAKGSQVDSATSQWFINLSDKNATDKDFGYTLDTNTGGFTVFGQVMGNGMQVVDAIAALSRFNMGNSTPFTTIPLRNYTASDAAANKDVTGDHLVLIEKIIVLNADPDTAAGLNPVKNTSVNKKDDSGSGSTGLISLLLLGLLALGRKSLLNRK
ncbi:MAG: hypothetical protein B0W54_20355 [Cellvibrio sp. 79]|nr:MAG: hypothetical protein B0W54_20355 [Cellvibrio sp. 79]